MDELKQSISGLPAIHQRRKVIVGNALQFTALLFCLLLGSALIVNNQLAGEATWFWYARLFHQGSKLYAGLHLALQPLMILEMNVWMQVFGIKCLVTEIPAVLHLLILCAGLYLLLRQSDWPDWQKAILIAGSFVFWIIGPSYRFDDYHVTTESFILYSLLLLVLLSKTELVRRQTQIAVALGILCGLAITSRLNDGVALFGATLTCLPILTSKGRLRVAGLYAAAAVFTWFAIIRCTGDTFSVYLASTLTKAVGSKGGAGTILTNPFHLFFNALYLRHGVRWLFLAFVCLMIAAVLIQRFWIDRVWAIVGMQVLLTPFAYGFTSHRDQQRSPDNALMDLALCAIVVGTYVLACIVLVRLAIWISSSGTWKWDTREILIFLPLAELASNAATASAQPRSGYYAQMVMALLLVPLLQPVRKQVPWANATLLAFLIWFTVVGTLFKERVPYFWDNLRGRPMFVDRQWYRHPIYGPMYIQTDLLQFSTSVCDKMGGIGAHPELLSIPFSYANYFCGTPPWHGYIQTFIDITAQSTMQKLLTELQGAPPQWIVYQRQMGSLYVLEQTFNHSRPSPQRALDTLITQKVASGEWTVVYSASFQYGDGWYVIRTRQ